MERNIMYNIYIQFKSPQTLQRRVMLTYSGVVLISFWGGRYLIFI